MNCSIASFGRDIILKVAILKRLVKNRFDIIDMDIDNIKNRMERAYLSIGQHFDENIGKHIDIKYKVDGKHWQTTVSFGAGEENKAEICNQIFIIISHIAKLKDHLKNLYASNGGDIKLIESEIESSEYLKLAIDLDNKEKHGKLEKSRSGRYPYLDDIDRALSVRAGGETQSSSFSIDPFTGQFETKGNIVITITAEVKASDGIRVCSLDELINKSMEKWEEIIKKYNLIKN